MTIYEELMGCSIEETAKWLYEFIDENEIHPTEKQILAMLNKERIEKKDRDKIIKDLEILRNNLTKLNSCSMVRTCDDAIALLKDQPEVVRCKDCVHYHVHFSCDVHRKLIDESTDFFCARGEKRTL